MMAGGREGPGTDGVCAALRHSVPAEAAPSPPTAAPPQGAGSVTVLSSWLPTQPPGTGQWVPSRGTARAPRCPPKADFLCAWCQAGLSLPPCWASPRGQKWGVPPAVFITSLHIVRGQTSHPARLRGPRAQVPRCLGDVGSPTSEGVRGSHHLQDLGRRTVGNGAAAAPGSPAGLSKGRECPRSWV